MAAPASFAAEIVAQGIRQPVGVFRLHMGRQVGQTVAFLPGSIGDVFRVQVRGGPGPVVGVFQNGPHHLAVKAVLLVDGLWKLGVLVEVRRLIDQRRHPGLMDHGFDLPTLRFGLFQLSLRQLRDRLKDSL